MDADTTGELGVNFVQRVVLRDMQWIFRVQRESDQGIDAQVETKVGGASTGRLLALQIKAGPSWFTSPSGAGWYFRCNPRQATLWLGHVLPVIVVLVDLDADAAYWQRVDETTLQSTGKTYRIHVPRENELKRARTQWELMASGLERRAAESYAVSKDYLPPDVAALLERMRSAAPNEAAVLALQLAEGRSEPGPTVRSLLDGEPGWTRSQPVVGWRAVAAFAEAHGLSVEAARALQLAAEEDTEDPGRLLVNAALQLGITDREASRTVLAAAEARFGVTPRSAVCHILLDHPDGDALPFAIEQPAILESEGARGDVVVLNFLAEHAQREGRLDDAVEYARQASAASGSRAGAKVRLAHLLARRGVSASVRDTDLAEAESLLRAAIAERRRWGGPVIEALDELLRLLALRGDFETMLANSAAPPIGDAAPSEAADPRVVRHAVHAAHFLGRADAVRSLVELLGEGPEDDLIRARVEAVSLDPLRRVDLLEEALGRALEDDDAAGMARVVLQLGQLGVDRTAALGRLIELGIISAAVADFAAACAAVVSDIESGLPRLRSLAGSDPSAAEYLVDVLSGAGEFTAAALAAEDAYETFRNTYFLLMRASALIDAADLGEAERACQEALAIVREGFGTLRGRLLTFLAGRSGERGDWASAEGYVRAAMRAIAQPGAGDYWRLVTTQVAQGELKRAADTIEAAALVPRNSEDAWMWLRCVGARVWDERLASEAVALALRFEESEPRLATALLTHLITATRGHDSGEGRSSTSGADDDAAPDPPVDMRPSVSAEHHRLAFAALDRLIDKHGPSTGLMKMTVDENDPLSEITEMLKARSNALRGLMESVQEGKIPMGAATGVLGRSYALALVQRSFGYQVAADARDDAHEKDVADAAAALGHPVVVEASTLMLIGSLKRGPELAGHFSRLLLPTSARLDISRALVEVRGAEAAGMTVSWDPESERLRAHERTTEEALEFHARARALDAAAGRAVTRATSEITVLPDWDRPKDDMPWLAPIQLASDEGAVLWSDDVALRAIAREAGVRCFGTPALTEYLSDRRLDELSELEAIVSERQEWVRSFVREAVVDVPAHLDDLLAQAESDGWVPAAGAVLLTRASWWAWQANPVADLAELYRRILASLPEMLAGWQYAAMEGIRKAYRDRSVAVAMISAAAALPYALRGEVDDLAPNFEVARRVARRHGLSDPVAQLPSAALVLEEAGLVDGAEVFARAALRVLNGAGPGGL